MKHGTQPQAQVIRTAIEEGQRDKIDEIITIINATGAIDYTSQAAKREVDNAKAALDSLADSSYKTALLALADFSIERTY
jgi:octaprenyl-diphosphate synthase